MKILLVFFIFILKNILFSLYISEIFFANNEYYTEDEKFIEIYNNEDKIFDLSELRIILPYGNKLVTNKLLFWNYRIENKKLVFDSYLLEKGQCAVVLTEDYLKFARLFSFNSNTIILKPNNKNGFNSSWIGKINKIKLMISNDIVFECEKYNPDCIEIKKGYSLSFFSNNYRLSGINPGYYNYCYFEITKPVVYFNENICIKFFNLNNLNKENIETFIKYSDNNIKKLNLYKVQSHYEINITIDKNLNHGDEILIYNNEASLILRYLNKKEYSSLNKVLLINELVTSPCYDYSENNWSNISIVGTINSSDDWIEIVNLSNSQFVLTNLYIYHKTKDSFSIKSVIFRKSSEFNKATNVITNYGYMIINSETGFANNAYIALYEGFPFYNGKIIDELEYGNEDILGDGIENNAPSGFSDTIELESIQRLPNAYIDTNISRLFKKGKSTPCYNNQILIDFKYKIDRENKLLRFYLFEKDYSKNLIYVDILNNNDEEKVILQNLNHYYYGEIKYNDSMNVFKNDNVFTVNNGERNYFKCYLSDGGLFLREFYWNQIDWNLSSTYNNLNNVKIFPSVIKSEETINIYFVNLTDDAEIYVMTENRNIIKYLKQPYEGMIVWEVSLKKGIYYVIVKNSRDIVYKKIFVY